MEREELEQAQDVLLEYFREHYIHSGFFDVEKLGNLILGIFNRFPETMVKECEQLITDLEHDAKVDAEVLEGNYIYEAAKVVVKALRDKAVKN